MAARPIEDKRRQARVPILGELAGDVTVVERMTIRELSRSGALIETNVPLRLNSLHLFKLPLGDRAVVLHARVVHCQVSEVASSAAVYRSGIEFLDVPEHTAEAIEEFVGAIEKRQAT